MRRLIVARYPRQDAALLGTASVLCLIGLLALMSAAASANPSLVVRQAIWIGLGVLISLAASSVPYTRWMDLGFLLYAGVVVLLLLVLWAGTVRMGSARWIMLFGLSVQPSELAKFATACVLARYLASQTRPLKAKALLVCAGLVALPAILVFQQPDLGSSSVLAAIWIGAIWAAGISRRQLALGAFVCAGLFPIGWHILKEYQRLRLLAFLNPHADPLGAGYTIIQSQIAIGSGQLLGRGWMSGTQNQLNFLPERHADFLYSVIAEEWGFVGAVAVVALFGLLVWRATSIALNNSESQGRYLAVALTCWIAYQACVNMGMVMGIVPVVGIPLPLVSYGGSAMLTTWLALGSLQSIHRFGTRF